MLNLEHKKALIFDFGNVIINIDFNRTFEAFQQLFGNEYDRIMQQYKQQNLHAFIESNEVTAEEMAKMFSSFSTTEFTAKQIATAWNALLLNLPEERLDLLQNLSKKYSLYLLSNTNKVHIDKIFGDLEQRFGENPLYNIFTELFLSYKMDAVKPNVELYKQVLAAIPFSADECLFFDDLQENLNGAKLLGIDGQLVTKETGIIELFKAITV